MESAGKVCENRSQAVSWVKRQTARMPGTQGVLRKLRTGDWMAHIRRKS